MWSSIELTDPELPDAAEDALKSLSAMGGFDEKPTVTDKPTVTSDTCTETASSTPYPTNTAVDVGDGFCYNDENAPNCNEPPHREFTLDDAQQVIGQFCEAGYRLQPSDSTVIGKSVV